MTLETAFRSLDDSQRFSERIDAMDADDPHISAYASLVKNYRQQFIDTIRRWGATSQDRLSLREILAGAKKKQNLADKMTGGGA